MILTTGLVDIQIEHWMDKKHEPIDFDAFQTIASWFMTSSPGNQFSLIAHDQGWDPLTTAFQIITELKVRDADLEAQGEDDIEGLKTVVYLTAMMAHVMQHLADSHYSPDFFTESE